MHFMINRFVLAQAVNPIRTSNTQSLNLSQMAALLPRMGGTPGGVGGGTGEETGRGEGEITYSFSLQHNQIAGCAMCAVQCTVSRSTTPGAGIGCFEHAGRLSATRLAFAALISPTLRL